MSAQVSASIGEIQPEIAALLPSVSRPLRGRDVYNHPRTHYAEIYGVSTRSVAAWIKHGLLQEPADPPPLDDPIHFITWWGKYMVHRVPDRLYEAASKMQQAIPVVQSAAPLSSAPGDLPRIDTAPASSGATGFLASLLRTREEEAAAHLRYKAAVEEPEPNEGKIRTAQRNWMELSEHLRQLDKSAPEILRRSGDMWLAVDVLSELATIHASIANGVRSLGRRFAVKSGIEWTPERDRQFGDEVNFIFRELVDSKFSAGGIA